jgi:hypothetical protein
MPHRRLLLTLALACAACASAGNAKDDAASPPPRDAAMVSTGATSTGMVAGSVMASSPHYKLIGTLNPGARSSSSSQYKERGGVLGATQP